MEGFKIVEFNDVEKDIDHLHKNGWDAGKWCGFQGIHNNYSMLPGSCTDWTGYPQSGKSELLLEFLLNTSQFYGWKHMLIVPDMGKTVEVMAKLIHKYTGKTFIKKYRNYIGIKEAFNACEHLIQHFKILQKTNPRAQATPIKFWEYAATYADKNDLHTAVIDSWKDMNHDYNAHGGLYSTYLSSVLPMRNQIAETSGLHFHTVIHPKNPSLNSKGTISAPNTFDMEGGAQWNNNGKCIISVHRESYENTIADIYFRKIKPESIGKPSHLPFAIEFDVASSRYFCRDVDARKQFAQAQPAPPPPPQVQMPIPYSEPDTNHVSDYFKKDERPLMPF